MNAFTRVVVNPRAVSLEPDGENDVASPLADHAVHVVSIGPVAWQEIARRDAAGEPDLVQGLDGDGRPVGGYRTVAELERDGALDALLDPDRAGVPRRLIAVVRGVASASSGADRPWKAGIASIEPPTFQPGAAGRTLDVGFEAAAAAVGWEPLCGRRGGAAHDDLTLRTSCSGSCLGVRLEVDDEGGAPCVVVEATDSDGDANPATLASCRCDPGLLRLDPEGPAAQFVDSLRQSHGHGGALDGRDCFCAIPEVPGSSADPGSPRHACQHEEHPPPGVDGWCYVDADAGLGHPDLVTSCPFDIQAEVRLVGLGRQRAASTVVVGCLAE